MYKLPPSPRPTVDSFPKVYIRILPDNQAIHVRLAISYNIYWCSLNSVQQPSILSHFINHSTLILSRLPHNATQLHLDNIISPQCNNDLVVSGTLHNTQEICKILISFQSTQQRDDALYAIRVRVAPHQLLHKITKHISTQSLDNQLPIIINKINAILIHPNSQHNDSEPDETQFNNLISQSTTKHSILSSSASTSNIAPHHIDTIASAMKNLNLSEDVTNLSAHAQLVTNAAITIARCVRHFHSMPYIFHAIHFATSIALNVAYANSGNSSLPDYLAKVISYLHLFLENTPIVLQSTSNSFIDPFFVLQSIIDAMGSIELSILQISNQKSINHNQLVNFINAVQSLQNFVIELSTNRQNQASNSSNT